MEPTTLTTQLFFQVKLEQLLRMVVVHFELSTLDLLPQIATLLNAFQHLVVEVVFTFITTFQMLNLRTALTSKTWFSRGVKHSLVLLFSFIHYLIKVQFESNRALSTEINSTILDLEN